jgi:hypothetical protein
MIPPASDAARFEEPKRGRLEERNFKMASERVTIEEHNRD